MSLYGITFLFPYVLLALFIYPICLYYCKEKAQSIYFSNMPMVKSATKNQGYILKVLRFLVFFFLVIALANPVKKDDLLNNEKDGYEISLIVDASGSMSENNKFTITKEILTDFIQNRATDRLALSVFADFAYVAVPLTYDKTTFTYLLNLLEVGVAGQRQTALYEALYLSSNLFKGSISKNKIAILLTDGMDNANTIPIEVAISVAKKYGIKVYTVGVGQTGDFDPLSLKQIADETKGKFYQASTKEELQKIYQHIDSLEKSKIKTDQLVKKTYLYQYPLDVAIGFLFILLLINRKNS
ncbi:MAG: VWA domain-containing protein [Arcobacteraceae bacterium]|jgi:Ca-activated chloride channel family protein|nr:VWA domain-containing protein [Arcobacteraceae bacterium]